MTEAEVNSPVIEVVSPSATEEDIAVVVAVLSAMGAPPAPELAHRSHWAGRAHDSWRSSAQPH